MKNNENEMFSSNVAGGSNDNTGKAVIVAIAVLIGGALLLSSSGITGGAVMAIPAIFAFLAYKAIK